MKKKILALACVVVLAVCVCACSTPSTPSTLSTPSTDKAVSKYIKISDSKATLEQAEDGVTMLVVDGIMQNTGEKTVKMGDLPQLTMDGTVVKAVYERTDNKPKPKLRAGASATYHVEVAVDPSVDHEWKFVEAEGTAVEGLDQVNCITEALHN